MPAHIKLVFAITASLIVLGALTWQNLEQRSGFGYGSSWGGIYPCSQGWPITFCKYRVEESYGANFLAPKLQSFDFTIIPLGVVVDLVVTTLIVVCVFVTCHGQLTLSNLLLFFTHATIVTYLYTDGIEVATILAELVDEEPNLSWHLSFYTWYTDLPIAFGIACTCTVFTSLILRGAHKALNFFYR